MKPMLLNGEWVTRAESLRVFDPENGQLIGSVPAADVNDVDQAVTGALTARETPLPSHERSRILREAALGLGDRAEEAAQLIATEGIKTIREARSEASRAVETLQLSAEEAKRIHGSTLNFDQYPSGEGWFGLSVRMPAGIVGAITPFNDPLNLVAHKVGPALASGNAVIVKPDSKTPLSALLLAETLMDAGLPIGWLQVLTGKGSVIGDAIVTHPAVDMVSFTGGVEAGRTVLRRAGLKRVQMELGANNAVIVEQDADLELAADRIGGGAFWAAGQNCLHVQRVYAHSRVIDELASRLAVLARAVVLGPKLAETTDMGPLIDGDAGRRVSQIVAQAVEGGAELLSGGEMVGSSFQPTLLTNVSSAARVLSEEVYGPVTSICSYNTLDQAIDLANDTEFGLQSAIFTKDLGVAYHVAARMRTGAVMVNESTDFRLDSMPFGGLGSSGLGREGVRSAVREMTETKVIAVSGITVPGFG